MNIPRPIVEWLNGLTPKGEVTIQRLAHLIRKNNGELEVTRVGPDGLNYQEGMELTELGNFLLGMAYITNSIPAVKAALLKFVSGNNIEEASEADMKLLLRQMGKSS